MLGAVLLAGLGLWQGPRLRAWALRLPGVEVPVAAWLTRRWRALLAAGHELGERRLLALLVVPGSPGVARAPGRSDLQAALVLALCGAIGVLAVVFANSDVVQVGPTRVYPVDVGGLDPALLGSRRGGAKPAAAAAPGSGELAPGTGELAPGTGELAPGTGDGRGAGLAPGTGELAPGTGDGARAPVEAAR